MSEAQPAAARDGLTSLPALEIARRVQDHEVSPVEVVRAHLERIDALEPAVGAFQVVRRDEALGEAARLTERADLATLPLAGVPVAVKDKVDVAGVPTRQGSAATSASPAGRDDDLVVRLRAAGCVVIGKTQMPELAVWPFTEPARFRAPRNPWDLSRTPGGSTGGGAAAVAAGLAALALGSDGGGSIRVPAACCGLFGLKPTPGVVPLAGGQSEHWCGMTAFGPLARTVADAAVALDVLAGTDTYRDPRPPSGSLRIACCARHPTFGARVSRRVRGVFDDAAGLLGEAGHTMVAARPPYPLTLGLRFSNRWLAGIAEDAEQLDLDALEDRTRRMVRRGRRVRRRVAAASDDPFAARMTAWMEDFDLLVTPALARGPVRIGTWAKGGWIRTTLGVANWIFTPAWNLAGLPAASVPFGTDDHGLPLGLQLVGKRGGEQTVLAVAAQIEALRPWPALAPLSPEAV